MQCFNKQSLGRLIILALFLELFSGCLTPKATRLKDTFDHYGYSKRDEKEALEYLIKRAGVLQPNEALDERFPERTDKNQLLKDAVKFIELTQDHFWLRDKTKERWEAKPKSWMLEKNSATEDALKTLGLVFEIPPVNAHPDAICVLGGSYPIMKERIGYLAHLIKTHKISAQHVILLAGERYATVGIDGSKEELKAIADKLHINDFTKLTETHLIKEAYQNSSIDQKLAISVIDTPRGNLPRPTTETTTLALINWLNLHPKYRSVVFISNQPYVHYQEAVIAEVFKALNCPVTFQVVGALAPEPLNIQMLLESLGSYLWAKTPQVMRELQINSDDEETIKRFKNFYRNNPVIYQHLEI